MANKEWKWTDAPMDIIEFMVFMGVDVYDRVWWEDWQDSYEGGYVFSGWDILEEDGRAYEYRRRNDIVQRYQQYRGWWKKESMNPRAVSFEQPIGEHRKDNRYE